MPSQPTFAFSLSDDDPWGRCFSHFLQHIYDRSNSTLSMETYRNILYRFFATSSRGGPPKHPTKYTREDVEDFIHRETKHGTPPQVATRNIRLVAISSFYHYAREYLLPDEHGDLRPLFYAVSPTMGLRQSRPSRSYGAFSMDEFERFFAAIPSTPKGLRDRAIFLTFFWTARRRSEIVNLNFGDIFEGTIVEDNGTRRPGWLYRFRGKGASQQEDIAELPGPARRAIDRYLDASGLLPLLRKDSPLFCGIWGGKFVLRRLSGYQMDYLLKQYATRAGLDAGRLSLHSFRHTAVQQRYAAGEDIRSLQRLLRHSNIATTDIYLRALMGTSDEGAKLLIDRFGRFSDM